MRIRTLAHLAEQLRKIHSDFFKSNIIQDPRILSLMRKRNLFKKTHQKKKMVFDYHYNFHFIS